jgi:hypothetical protein
MGNYFLLKLVKIRFSKNIGLSSETKDWDHMFRPGLVRWVYSSLKG